MSVKSFTIQCSIDRFGEDNGKREVGRSKLAERKIYSYADDIVLMAENKEGIRAMIAKVEEYLEMKRLKVNVKKIKIMIFRKGEGRRKKTIEGE